MTAPAARRMRGRDCAVLLLALGGVTGCAGRPEGEQGFREIVSPAPPGSLAPNLALTPDGRYVLSWVQQDEGGGHSLRFATRAPGGAWTAPRMVVAGADWFVNWADFPSMAAPRGADFVAHWLVRSGKGDYDYDVRLSRSSDGGESWSDPISPYAYGGEGEHGFVSLVPWPDGRVDVVWLDGRHLADERGATELRHARLGADGRPGPETVLDPRVCDCCQTSAARVEDGILVVYRDREKREIRDITAVRYHNGRWEEPRALSQDGWEIDGCPVNGPAIDAEGGVVAVAWYTGARDHPAVRVAFSEDGGATWGDPIPVDDGRPIGRVDVVATPGGGAFVMWMERAGAGAEIRLRHVEARGRRDASIKVTSSSVGRSSGFPRLASSGGEILAAWTSLEDPPRVRAASLTRSRPASAGPPPG